MTEEDREIRATWQVQVLDLSARAATKAVVTEKMPMTVVEEVAKKVIKHLRKELVIPQSFTALRLYIRSGQLQLPLSFV